MPMFVPILIAALLAALALVSPALSQSGEAAVPQQRGRAIEALIEGTGEASLRAFADDHLSPAYRESFAPGQLIALLARIRETCAHFNGIEAGPAEGGGTRLTFRRESGASAVVFRLEPTPPRRIVSLILEPEAATVRRDVEVAPITWDNLEARLEAEAARGFSGTVLVRRGGEIVLHRSYGVADRERRRPVGTESIFAIGSTPIDFTRAAILKLAEMGRLRLSDTLGVHLAGVPADKRTMTLDHLLRGRSGLPDFHHLESDEDKDLSWIDRDTAVRRILGRPLRFSPGESRAHSHSAWVLLAAIVEVVSGEPYGAFLRRHFLGPAGLTRTGLHEDVAHLPDSAFAEGLEGQGVGVRNTPKHWGRTSWLVMGSGGMASTPGDLDRWLTAIHSGRTLSPASAERYFTNGLMAGGDDRGFLCMYTEGADDRMILSSNAHSGPGDRAAGVGRRLAELVRSGASPRFSLGIEFGIEDDGRVLAQRVLPGSAAERGGLRSGDLLRRVNGKPLGEPLMGVLTPLLQTGEPLTFEIERAGERRTVTVRPDPRK